MLNNLVLAATAQQPDADSFVRVALFIFGAFVGLCMLCGTFRMVTEKNAAVVERLGKYRRVMHPGLHVKLPLFDKVAARVSLQIQQLSKDIEAKTKNNIFVKLPVAVQYRVDPEQVRAAHYALQNPQEIIVTLVLNEVRTLVASMTLDEVFTNRDHLQTQVHTQLATRFGEYGYIIENVVIDSPDISDDLKKSYNDVTAAELAQAAAGMQAEALRIKLTGEASAEGESLEIKAKALVEFRKILANGSAEAINQMIAGTDLSAERILRYFETLANTEAITEAAGKGATIVVATPNPGTDGLYATLSGPQPAAA